ncbi:MAG: M48 family metalloprotease [bacterium]|nr:M48 family metalloprotease [bacterium]
MKRTALIVLAAAMLTATMGCATFEGLNLVSTADEVAIGGKVAEEVEKKETILADAAMQTYVQNIGARLAALAPRKDVTYSFKVIDNPDTVNAFALPGGKMYLYTGLMKLCGNEAELAGVMAHEIAHVASYHHGESMTRQGLVSMAMSLVLGSDPSTTAQVVAGLAGIGATGVEARYSRGNEQEADQLGMTILYQAGYNPNAMITFMNKMLAEEKRKGGGHPLPIFASHPPTTDRLQYLRTLEASIPADLRASGRLNAYRYKTSVLNKIQ